jgi:hypothetical protein
MTVAELIELLKKLPQDYVVKSGTQNDRLVDDITPELVHPNDEEKIVVL